MTREHLQTRLEAACGAIRGHELAFGGLRPIREAAGRDAALLGLIGRLAGRRLGRGIAVGARNAAR